MKFENHSIDVAVGECIYIFIDYFPIWLMTIPKCQFT